MPANSLPKLKKAYVLGLGFAAVILILAYLLSLQVIKTQETGAWVVNVSGRQRMLSQEIAFLALANEPDTNLTKENIHLQYLLGVREMFRAALDQTVNQYQLESERKVNELQKLETAFVVIILLVLLIETIYVFRPLTKIVLMEKRELETANACLRDLSNLDGLTGIANRRYFDEYLNEVWVRSGSSLQYLTLIMCDIKFFQGV